MKMPLAKTGNERGVCDREARHRGKCGNGTCWRCGVKLSAHCGVCSLCSTEITRERYGYEPQKYQIPGKSYTFPCGCSGVLPNHRGKFNQFVRWSSQGKHGEGYWRCRISVIFESSQKEARNRGYEPINLNTPHSIVRKMMEKEKSCVLCAEPVDWTVHVP